MNYRLESRDGVIYFVTENGKAYKFENVLNHRAHIRVLDELRDEYTRRREWWRRRVVSRDMPNSKAARADLSDRGKWERELIKWLDGEFAKQTIEPFPFGATIHGKPVFKCVIAKQNCQHIAHEMMLVDWRRIGYFAAAVWKNGHEDHEKTMEDFGISEPTYYWRLAKYASILHFSRSC